jgi:hypothetical protein
MKNNGTNVMARLTSARKLLAHPTPQVWYIGVVANGRTAPKILRLHEDADMADAEKMLYASPR